MREAGQLAKEHQVVSRTGLVGGRAAGQGVPGGVTDRDFSKEGLLVLCSPDSQLVVHTRHSVDS